MEVVHRKHSCHLSDFSTFYSIFSCWLRENIFQQHINPVGGSNAAKSQRLHAEEEIERIESRIMDHGFDVEYVTEQMSWGLFL